MCFNWTFDIVGNMVMAKNQYDYDVRIHRGLGHLYIKEANPSLPVNLLVRDLFLVWLPRMDGALCCFCI